MKVSWGVGITIVIIVFTVVSLAFVYFAMQQDVNLVRDDYYEEELRHQDKIEQIKRTQTLEEDLTISSSSKFISFQFPKEFSELEISGSILLYRASDRGKDKSFAIKPDSNMIQLIATESISPGYWKVQVNWETDSLDFFNEKVLMIQ